MTSSPLPSGPPPGLTVGGYELLARIGEGGMGVVHLARQPGGERIALKVIRPHIVGDDEARERLAREVSSLQRIHSRRVAEIIDADPFGEIPFVATRYVPGLSLAEHVAQEGPIVGEDLTWFAWCLAEALSDVHTCGVLHRDIKPSNVLLEGRNPVLIDFGLARVADDPKLTHVGWLLGTPGYLAPEILHGHDATTASDVHSWAATVAFAGLGRSPFGAGPSAAIMDRVRVGEHDLVGLTAPLDQLLDSALSPHPAERPTLPYLLSWLRRQVGSTPTASMSQSISESITQSTSLQLVVDEPVPEPPVVAAPEPWHTMPLSLFAPEVPQQADSGFGGEALTSRLDAHGVPVEHTRVLAAMEPPVTAPAPPSARADSVVGKPSFGERLRRGVVLLLATLDLGLAQAAYPYLAVAAILVAVWILRSLSQTASGHHDRRRMRGQKWYDAPQSLLTTPWHLISSLPMTLMLAVWALLIALAVGLIAFAFNVDAVSTLVLGGATLGVALWLGPGGSRVRGPLGVVVRSTARHPGGWALACVLLVAAGGVALAALRSHGIDWSPYNSGPLSGVAQWPDWLPQWLPGGLQG